MRRLKRSLSSTKKKMFVETTNMIGRTTLIIQSPQSALGHHLGSLAFLTAATHAPTARCVPLSLDKVVLCPDDHDAHQLVGWTPASGRRTWWRYLVACAG